jgi:hypothetical protein
MLRYLIHVYVLLFNDKTVLSLSRQRESKNTFDKTENLLAGTVNVTALIQKMRKPRAN